MDAQIINFPGVTIAKQRDGTRAALEQFFDDESIAYQVQRDGLDLIDAMLLFLFAKGYKIVPWKDEEHG